MTAYGSTYYAGSGIDDTVLADYPAECDHRDDHTGEPCTWAGDIDLRVDPTGHANWTCPRCDTWHDVERDGWDEYL